MAVGFYDEALFNKIKKWVKDPNMHILKPEESSRLFEIATDESKDEPLKLPLISLSRNKDIEILQAQKQPKSFDAYMIDSSETQHITMNVIPIKLGYQLDLYVKGMEEADEYMRNFVFNFINYPHLRVNIPYNGLNIEHNASVFMEQTIVDNSDIREHLFADQFVRFTFKLWIDDAYLFSLPITTNSTLLCAELNVEDWSTKEIVESDKIL